ncbi:MAG TPA: SurA N-terminal domain-containing protein [Rhizomicrobium sp.]|jgi:peptidyl-prolyl cis-trans isomerase D|nr:SurA N-terminal domain-containing protein [Rhizomicrobium sp.]
MLQQMRKYTKSWISSLFLGLLALSFGVWGIADIFRGNSDTSVATVGGEKIPVELFQRDYRNVTRAATQKGPLKPAQARAYGQQVLDALVDQTALDTSAGRYGLTATDETVSARIRAIPNFLSPLGTFDHNIFLRMIDQAGFNEQSFVQYVRGALQRDQIVGAASSGLDMPAGYARALFNYLNEARAADYIVVPANAAGQAPTPTDAELNAYLKAHPERFSTPEYREVTFASISPQDLAGKVTVTAAQLKQQYEAQKSQYVIPEKRQLEQITYSDLASAKAARAKVDSGTSFAELAKQKGLSAADTQIGDLSKADLGDRGDAVFKLQKDGVTQPLKAPIGYALIHVVSITPGSTKTLDDVKEELRKQIFTQLAGAKITDISNQYIDENSRGLNLTQAATKAGMHVGHVAGIDARGNTPDGTKAAVPSDPEFLAQIFKAEVGEEGDPFSTKSGTTYVVKVDGVRPPKLKPLDSIRAEVTAAWQKEQQSKRLDAKAKELAQQASTAHSLIAVASSVGTKVQASGPLRRPGPNTRGGGPLPTPLLTKVFSVPAGQAVYGPAPDGSYIVALVTAVQHPPAMVLQGAGLRRFAASIGQQAGQDIGSGLTAAARAKVGVSVNQQTVDRATGNESG